MPSHKTARIGWALLVLSSSGCGDGCSARRPSSIPSSSTATALASPTATASDVTSAAAYLAKLTPVACDNAVRCLVLDASKRSECLTGPDKSSIPEVWEHYGARDAVEMDRDARKGRYRFDDRRADECVALLAKESCHGDWTLPRHCDPLVRAYLAPAVATGGSCTRSDQCLEGFCDAAKGAEGKCVPFLAAGAKCRLNQESCGPHSDCGSLRVENSERVGECTRLRGLTQACSLVEPCDDHLYCTNVVAGVETGECRALPDLGEACAGKTESITCRAGLSCPINDAAPRCKAPLPAGSVCTTDDACAEGLGCEGLKLGDFTLVHAGTRKVLTRGTCKLL